MDPIGGRAWPPEESVEDDPAIDKKLMNLPFKDRWESIGARPRSSATQHGITPEQTEGSRLFSRVDCSFRLQCSSACNVQSTGDDAPLAFLKPLQRNRRHEPGSPDRLMKKSKSAQAAYRPSIKPRTDRGNPLQDVSLGLEALRTGNKEQLKSAKASRLSRILLMDVDDQHSPTATELRAKRRRQKDTLGQRVALTEFKRWCVSTFGSLDEAWHCIDPQGRGRVSKSEFVAALQDREYATGDLGIRNVFFFLDTDDDDVVVEKDFHDRLEEIVIGQTKSSPLTEATQGKSSLMDPVEACAVAEGGTTVAAAQAKLVHRIRETDPVVAQFIEYMMKSFHTLRMAFNRMDMNNNGSISKGEFQDTLRAMHSNTGSKPIQEHLKSLFCFIDATSSGYITLDEFIHNVKGNEPLVARLREYLTTDLPMCEQPQANELDATVIDELRRAFKVQERQSKIKFEQFVDGMTRLRYVDWHVKDLWTRLDQDNSGQLTLSEFTAFLLKDTPPPRKDNASTKAVNARRGSLVPLGSIERRKKLEKSHIACSESVKLGMSAKSFHARSKQKGHFPNPKWQSPTPWCMDGSINRPDYLGIVQAGLRKGCSELRQRGQHVLVVSSEPAVDLCGSALHLHSSEIIGMSCVQDL